MIVLRVNIICGKVIYDVIKVQYWARWCWWRASPNGFTCPGALCGSAVTGRNAAGHTVARQTKPSFDSKERTWGQGKFAIQNKVLRQIISRLEGPTLTQGLETAAPVWPTFPPSWQPWPCHTFIPSLKFFTLQTAIHYFTDTFTHLWQTVPWWGKLSHQK